MIGDHGLAGSGANNYATQEPQDPKAVGLVQQSRTNVEHCNEMLSHLHNFADQFVGIRGEEKALNKPAPVPNGFVEELRDATQIILERLNSLCVRLSVL